MKLSPETRDIIRQYKTAVNEYRKSFGLSPLKTERIIEEICYHVTCQCSVYIGGAFIIQSGQDATGK